MTNQERQQQFLADFNAWHEVAKQRYGYALTVAPVVQTVQTGEGPRIEIGMRFGLQEVVGWKENLTPQAPSPLRREGEDEGKD